VIEHGCRAFQKRKPDQVRDELTVLAPSGQKIERIWLSSRPLSTAFGGIDRI